MAAKKQTKKYGKLYRGKYNDKFLMAHNDETISEPFRFICHGNFSVDSFTAGMIVSARVRVCAVCEW